MMGVTGLALELCIVFFAVFMLHRCANLDAAMSTRILCTEKHLKNKVVAVMNGQKEQGGLLQMASLLGKYDTNYESDRTG